MIAFDNLPLSLYRLSVGPSYSIDTASSTSLIALHQGFKLIKDGACENCIVAGVDLVLNPTVSLMFQNLNMLSPGGKCRSFDAEGIHPGI